ncbi:MAG: malonyl-[acyl-carrier protein] O-methyltransferase BioC, partial [Pseudomonadota bacterium]|nr:malonyl-[acyl-carrier protein] O-methyltransferase BioC [Pseudomonadota bacterium]
LMRDLKNLGAHNAASERMRGLTGKSWLARLTQEYESFKQQGRFPATFEVVYGHAWAGPGLSSVQGKTIKIFPERRVS